MDLQHSAVTLSLSGAGIFLMTSNGYVMREQHPSTLWQGGAGSVPLKNSAYYSNQREPPSTRGPNFFPTVFTKTVNSWSTRKI